MTYTHARLRQIMQAWQAWSQGRPTDLERLWEMLDEAWDHVNAYLELPRRTPPQSEEAREVYTLVLQGLGCHARACARLEQALADGELEACAQVMDLLRRGDRLLEQANDDISVYRCELGQTA